jgi:hypothetical protein
MSRKRNFPTTYVELIDKIMHVFSTELKNMNKNEMRRLGYKIVKKFNKKVQQHIFSQIPPAIACNEFKLYKAPEIKDDFEYAELVLTCNIPEQQLVNVYILHQTYEELVFGNNIASEVPCRCRHTQTNWTLAEKLAHLSSDLSRCIIDILPNIQK